jgi:hypothetical protein
LLYSIVGRARDRPGSFSCSPTPEVGRRMPF